MTSLRCVCSRASRNGRGTRPRRSTRRTPQSRQNRRLYRSGAIGLPRARRGPTRSRAPRLIPTTPPRNSALLRDLEASEPLPDWAPEARAALHAGVASVVDTGHVGSVWSVAFSPDGRRIASGAMDATVRATERRRFGRGDGPPRPRAERDRRGVQSGRSACRIGIAGHYGARLERERCRRSPRPPRSHRQRHAGRGQPRRPPHRVVVGRLDGARVERGRIRGSRSCCGVIRGRSPASASAPTVGASPRHPSTIRRGCGTRTAPVRPLVLREPYRPLASAALQPRWPPYRDRLLGQDDPRMEHRWPRLHRAPGAHGARLERGLRSRWADDCVGERRPNGAHLERRRLRPTHGVSRPPRRCRQCVLRPPMAPASRRAIRRGQSASGRSMLRRTRFSFADTPRRSRTFVCLGMGAGSRPARTTRPFAFGASGTPTAPASPWSCEATPPTSSECPSAPTGAASRPRPSIKTVRVTGFGPPRRGQGSSAGTRRTSTARRSAPTDGGSLPARWTRPCAYGTWRALRDPTVLRGHTDGVCSVAFGPDGSRIASGSWDRTVRVWRADGSGDPVVLHGHADRVYSVAFSPDGRRIASASADKSVPHLERRRFWRATRAPRPFARK